MNYEDRKELCSSISKGKFTSDEVNLIVAMMEYSTDNGFWDEFTETEELAWKQLLKKVA